MGNPSWVSVLLGARSARRQPPGRPAVISQVIDARRSTCEACATTSSWSGSTRKMQPVAMPSGSSVKVPAPWSGRCAIPHL